MDSHKEWRPITEQEEKLEKLRRREKWLIEQECRIKHEKRKLKMIEEYERKRAKAMKIDKQESLQRSKSNSPQRRETSSSDYEYFKERKASMTIKGPDGTIIDTRELRKIKISIIHEESSLSTKDQSMSKEIERDIINPDDIILPRRQNEGSRPIFERNEIKIAEKTQTVAFSQDEQLEKQLSTSNSAYTCRRNLGNDITQHYYDSSSYKRTIYRDDRTNDNDRYKRNRRRSSSRDSKEKVRSRNERRDRSSSHYSNRSAKNRSRSRCSHSPVSKQAKERKIIDNDKNKFSSRRNYPDRSSKLDNRASSESSTNYSSSNSFYNHYIYLPRPMLMPRLQAPSMLMPVFPGPFPASFPPMNMYRWQQPSPKFICGRGINQKLR